MTNSLGVDFSTARPKPAALVAAGVTFVCRYYSTVDPLKILSLEEAAGYAAVGIWCVGNWENDGYQDAGPNGADDGGVDGLAAGAQARACRQPAGTPIYSSADYDVPASQYPAWAAYYRAFATASGYQAGCYGPAALVSEMVAVGACKWGWQSDAWDPSGGVASGVSVVQQLNASPIVAALGAVDEDIAVVPYFGQWQPDTVWPGNDPPPPPGPVALPLGVILPLIRKAVPEDVARLVVASVLPVGQTTGGYQALVNLDEGTYVTFPDGFDATGALADFPAEITMTITTGEAPDVVTYTVTMPNPSAIPSTKFDPAFMAELTKVGA